MTTPRATCKKSLNQCRWVSQTLMAAQKLEVFIVLCLRGIFIARLKLIDFEMYRSTGQEEKGRKRMSGQMSDARRAVKSQTLYLRTLSCSLLLNPAFSFISVLSPTDTFSLLKSYFCPCPSLTCG